MYCIIEIYSYDTCKDNGPSGLPGSGTLQTIGFMNPQPDIDYSDWGDGDTDTITSVLYSDSNFDVIGKTIKIPIALDSKTIGTNSDVYSTYEDTAGKTQGKMEFCVRYSLRTLNPNDPAEMNFREVLVTLDVILSPNSFTLNGAVVVDTADVNTVNDLPDKYDGVFFNLICYLCNPVTGNELIVGDNIITNVQGELIDICVKPTVEDRADGIVMNNIESFTWTRNDVSTIRTQIAVENGQPSTNGLSSYIPENCPFSEYCTFNTFLSSPFYFDGQGIVGGSGTATLTFEGSASPNAGRRQRQRRMDVKFNIMDNNNSNMDDNDTNTNSNAKRSLQDNNNNNNNNNNGGGLFDLQVNIAGMDFNTNGQQAAAASTTTTGASSSLPTAIAAAAAATALLAIFY
jgi:hypothetical protein